jgi:hypothetical protein
MKCSLPWEKGAWERCIERRIRNWDFCAIQEIGEHDGRLFIVIELIKSGVLRFD